MVRVVRVSTHDTVTAAITDGCGPVQRGVLVEDGLDLCRVDPVDVTDAQRGHVAVALQVLVEERHLACGEVWGDMRRYAEIPSS
jgi:hypothetical protein